MASNKQYRSFNRSTIYKQTGYIIYIYIYKYKTKTGATSGIGTVYLPEHLSSPRFQWDSCCSIFSFMCIYFVLFLLTIVFSVLLRFTDSDYSFGIFRLFFYISCSNIYISEAVGAPSTISVPPLILRIVHRFKAEDEDSNIGIDGTRGTSRHVFVYVICLWFL